MSSRRDFLKSSGLVIMTGGAFLSTEQFLAGQDTTSQNGGYGTTGDDKQKPTLVTIFLRGGADSLHTFIPSGDDLYYQYRPNIAIPSRGDRSALKLGKSKYWGLNPHMEPLVELIEAGQVVPIVNVGSPHSTRSHFSAQDYMERAAPGNNVIKQGWLNRYLELTKMPYDLPLRGLSARSLVPRALRGHYPVLAGNNGAEQLDRFEQLYASDNLVQMTAREGADIKTGSRLDAIPGARNAGERPLTADMTRDIITVSGRNAVERIKALRKAATTRSRARYPGALGLQLRAIAKVIKANVGLEVAQADYNGWDHHSNQGGVDGRMSQMLGEVSQCLAAFHKDLGPRMNKVLVMVMSEFGRTVHENGNYGTDHGRGGFMIAMGNMLNGRQIYGKWNGLEQLDYGRFQQVTTDFRAVFAESLAKLFRFDPFKSQIFPDYRGGPRNYINFAQQLKDV